MVVMTLLWAKMKTCVSSQVLLINLVIAVFLNHRISASRAIISARLAIYADYYFKEDSFFGKPSADPTIGSR
ncbi:hypothetical protein BAE46_03275 [Glaciecola punicea]|nr:hypothetical protein BAE46_03275 [Glaciecola punicea]